MYKHYFRDMVTDEIFPIETSFAIIGQALRASPKYKLAMLENSQNNRFEFINTIETPTPSKKEGEE